MIAVSELYNQGDEQRNKCWEEFSYCVMDLGALSEYTIRLPQRTETVP